MACSCALRPESACSAAMRVRTSEYSRIRRQRVPGVVTGKPVELGGSLGRGDATGRGAYYCVKELEKRRGWDPAGKHLRDGVQLMRAARANGFRPMAGF